MIRHLNTMNTITDMSAARIKQLQHESDTWKRMLGFMMEENILLKNRLSEVLKESGANGMLEVLDQFQTRFIEQDQRIAFLRSDIAEIDRLLRREVFEDPKITGYVEERVLELRAHLKLVEDEFSRMKTDFLKYLADQIA